MPNPPRPPDLPVKQIPSAASDVKTLPFPPKQPKK